MGAFELYLRMGIEHITDPTGYDHMLFLITLCAVYHFRQWKNLLILVTAFTIGHSLTLALSALDIFRLSQGLVEFLIGVTIFLTGVYNLFTLNQSKHDSRSFNYFMALFFGLIHGMGFSNFFRAMGADNTELVWNLFSFNVGLEIGQLVIVAIFFLFYFILERIFAFAHRDWTIFMSAVGMGLSFFMIIERFPV